MAKKKVNPTCEERDSLTGFKLQGRFNKKTQRCTSYKSNSRFRTKDLRKIIKTFNPNWKSKIKVKGHRKTKSLKSHVKQILDHYGDETMQTYSSKKTGRNYTLLNKKKLASIIQNANAV